MNNEMLENKKRNYEEQVKNQCSRLEQLKEQLISFKKNNDEKRIAIYIKKIERLMKNIDLNRGFITTMRPHTESDVEERTSILENYTSMIDSVIPDEEPIVFHGNNNINIVQQIIESGGLTTPEERGEDFKSFATQVDVTAKTNVRVSLEFADPGFDSFMPYGAIFAFYPKDHEKDTVLKTGSSTEVSGGVESIKFSEDRFVGVITTAENLEKIRNCLKENGYDPNKAFTHESFIERCKDKYPEQNNEMHVRAA